MPKSKLRIGVIFGGRSAEHEVSLVSAASVMANLDKRKYEVVPIGITKDGRWLRGKDAHRLLSQSKAIPDKLRVYLPPEPQTKALVGLKSPKKASQGLDIVFPVLHGPYGEDGTIQGLFELAGIPYVGCGVLGSAVGMDKVAQKLIYMACDIPTADFLYTSSTDYHKDGDKFLSSIKKRLGFPCFIKPPNLGSSVGISKVHGLKELPAAIRLALRYDRKVIVERGIEDAMEIECAVLGNDRPTASVAGQIISSNEFYDYNAKYVDGKSEAVIPAPLPPKVMRQVRSLAVRAFTALDLAGIARVDFLVQRKGFKIYLNEVNTLPGFTSISMYPKLWEASGLTYPKLLDELVRLGLERGSERRRLATSYQPKTKWYR
jgi:D-alanine-D-alanine ligase